MKRRERVERWRRDRKLKKDILAVQQKAANSNSRMTRLGKWSFDNDDDEDDASKTAAAAAAAATKSEEPDVDPLDAYMQVRYGPNDNCAKQQHSVNALHTTDKVLVYTLLT